MIDIIKFHPYFPFRRYFSQLKPPVPNWKKTPLISLWSPEFHIQSYTHTYLLVLFSVYSWLYAKLKIHWIGDFVFQTLNFIFSKVWLQHLTVVKRHSHSDKCSCLILSLLFTSLITNVWIRKGLKTSMCIIMY